MCTAFTSCIVPYPDDATSIRQRLLSPSAQFSVGSANLGREVLSGLVYGAR